MRQVFALHLSEGGVAHALNLQGTLRSWAWAAGSGAHGELSEPLAQPFGQLMTESGHSIPYPSGFEL